MHHQKKAMILLSYCDLSIGKIIQMPVRIVGLFSVHSDTRPSEHHSFIGIDNGISPLVVIVQIPRCWSGGGGATNTEDIHNNDGAVKSCAK